MASGAGEMLASAVVKEVVKMLNSCLWKEIGLLCNFRNDLEDMKGTLITLEAVLNDAEKRSGSAAERLWLKRLKASAYDIEDLLCTYEALIPVKKEKSLDNIVQKLRNFFSRSNPAISTITMSHKIKGMRKKLNNIAAEHVKFNFIEGVNYVDQQEIDRATNSILDQDHTTTIVGRDEEKENLVTLLLDSKQEGYFGIISIVGFCGLGKTTLAQLLYNDERVTCTFELRAWVYVSMKFNLKKIAEDIIESIKSSSGNPGLYNTEEAAYKELEKLLKGKRFLIVLDDLWEENGIKLEKLKRMLQGGLKSSKVILTTRNKNVGTLIGATHMHFLNILLDKHCWVLFSQRAFKYKCSVDIANQELVEIGREIVKKCKGVPLVAKTFGFIMKDKEGAEAWRRIKDSELWELEENGSSCGVLQSLKLSYYNMPPYLKICFAYCSIFPKGFQIEKFDLVRQWIALGFIRPDRPNEQLRQVGEEYVNSLTCMSFLQDSAQQIGTLEMHDLVHDLARYIAGDETFICNGGMQNNNNPISCQYVLLADYSNSLVRPATLPKRVKSLHFRNCWSIGFHDHAKKLRVLVVSDCQIEKLPTSIGMLKRLRYLRCENLPITTIPDSIGNLDVLQSFVIMWCGKIRTLPKSIGGLINLRFLQICGSHQLEALPETLGDLKSLKELIIGFCDNLKSIPESIGRLTSLNELVIGSCGELVNLPETIGHLTSLNRLTIWFCISLHSLPRSVKQLSRLRTLTIAGSSKLVQWCNAEDEFKNAHIASHFICVGPEFRSGGMDAGKAKRVSVRLKELHILDETKTDECARHGVAAAKGFSAVTAIYDELNLCPSIIFRNYLLLLTACTGVLIVTGSTKLYDIMISIGLRESRILNSELGSPRDVLAFMMYSTYKPLSEGSSGSHQTIFDPLNLNCYCNSHQRLFGPVNLKCDKKKKKKIAVESGLT